jgi:hypothetical protein
MFPRRDVNSLRHLDALGASGVHAWTMPCNKQTSFLPPKQAVLSSLSTTIDKTRDQLKSNTLTIT